MNQNEELILKFYQSFQAKDKKSMLECYHDEVEFRDPVFGIVRGVAAKAMWLMLLEKGNDLRIEYRNISATEDDGRAEWTAHYTYSKTDRFISNKVKASFKFKDGKIIFHRDNFSVWRWAGMALGIPGYILGFTPFIQNQIKIDAQTGLRMYIKRKRMSGST
jgi:ketosteroid isomerase-like protein